MQIIEVPILDIKPYEKNAKVHPKDQISKIAKSISAFGFQQPLVLDKDKVIVVGHGRYLAAKELGLEKVPVVYVKNLTDAQIKAYRLADNKLNESDWDMKLALPELKELSEDLVSLTGFSLDLLFESDEKDDEVPEVPEEPTSKLGDIYKLGNHRVMCGDSTKLEDVERLMDGKKADMVFTDPPYGINVVGKGGNIGGGTKSAPTTKFRPVIGDEVEFDPAFILPYSPNVFLWGGNYFAHLLPRGGRWFVWDKNRPEGLSLSDCELAWSNIKGVKVQKFKCTWDGYHKEGERGKRIHPNQKPIKLIADVLDEVSNKDWLILDFFLGAGSTIIAAEKTSRICYGMEIDPKYVDVIVKRWEDFTGQKAKLA